MAKGHKSYISRSTARAIINMLMACYKAGLKDAEYVSDPLLCQDFKQSVREPGVYGRVIDDYTMNQREWRISLLYINGARTSSVYTRELLENIQPGKSYISCVLPVAQEFYVLGLDDYNAYPHIHDFTLMDNTKFQKWTRKGIVGMSTKDVIVDIQRACMSRARADEEHGGKHAIRRYHYDWFAGALWAALSPQKGFGDEPY